VVGVKERRKETLIIRIIMILITMMDEELMIPSDADAAATFIKGLTKNHYD